MADNEEGSSTLGKRGREENGETAVETPEMPSADVDDSSDEEIGPMPVPAGEESNGGANGTRKKKKRAGE
jgi:peptidylprolyl isomerase domain and WD repeat-containing protein 1